MHLEDFLKELPSYTIEKKLILFHQLFKWHKKGRRIRWGKERNSFKFKLKKPKDAIIGFIKQAQMEKPFFDRSISNRIFEVIEDIKKRKLGQIGLHNEIIKYEFIAHQFRLLASTKKLQEISCVPVVTNLFNNNELEQAFNTIFLDFTKEHKISSKSMQKEMQYAIEFVAEFYILNHEHRIENIISIILDSLRKEINSQSLSATNKEIMFYYFSVANFVGDFDLYKYRNGIEPGVVLAARRKDKEKEYKELLRANIVEIGINRLIEPV
jgi:hypothetical protein